MFKSNNKKSFARLLACRLRKTAMLFYSDPRVGEASLPCFQVRKASESHRGVYRFAIVREIKIFILSALPKGARKIENLTINRNRKAEQLNIFLKKKKNSKNLLVRFLIGAHKGLTTSTLPQEILYLQNNPLIRIIRFLGGISSIMI